MSHPLDDLHNAIRALVLRGVVAAVNDTGAEQTIDVGLHFGQTRSAVPVLQPFGFSSVPPLDGAVAHLIQTGADPSDLVALAVANPSAARMGGAQPGETVAYDAAGQKLYFQNGALVRIDANTEMLVSIGGQTVLDVTASGVAITGNLKVSGDVTAGQISLQNHVHGGVQTGGGQTGTPQG